MGSFLESEKQHQIRFKASSPHFSLVARGSGLYKSKPRPFCLPPETAEENLFPRIRVQAVSFFAEHRIRWHDGQKGKPSNHLCDSQVCCVNFLFPFADEPVALAQLLRPTYPYLERMLPIENGAFVTFEWIGKENYLRERHGSTGQRTRGANFTSADAAVMFETAERRCQIVLIEWKYTESYRGVWLGKARSGTDRRRIYQHLYDAPDCPIDRALVPSFDSLFYEPFYQLMRQQFLAREMEKARELDADSVSVLHVAPRCNLDFRRVTSPALARLAGTATGVWKRLVPTRDGFASVDTERLFGFLVREPPPQLAGWRDYIAARYPWVHCGDGPRA